MSLLSMLPSQCFGCGAASPSALCRACSARFQRAPTASEGGRCALCDQVLLGEAGLCVDCAAQTWSFPVVDGLFGYQEPVGELLRLYKFSGLARLARSWASGAATRLDPRAPLVPVPPLRSHLWSRGWDPVATFVQAVAQTARLPVLNVLTRRASASQKTLDRAGRFTNAQQAYALRYGAQRRLKGVGLVWLVDDVVTTGATVEVCSRVLRQAGVGEVRVFCLGLH